MYTEWISMAARKPVHPNDPSGFTPKKGIYKWDGPFIQLDQIYNG